MLRDSGWEVWIAPDLKGSFEELPPTLIDYAKRDRRWCQGNLQHLRMVFAKDFSGLSRLYFLMGIMSYVSSPLWLCFLILTGFEAYVMSQTMPVYFFGDNLFPVWPESYVVEMTTVLLVTLSMLFLPKFWSLILGILNWRRLKGYGGLFRATLSVVLESVFSMLTAPVLMIYQSKFVLAILMRRSVGWPPQNRDDHRLGLWEAIQAHGEHTLIGLLAGWISYRYVQGFFLWLIPVLAGLVLSIPLSMLSSSTAAGLIARRLGLFLTPEECREPRVIQLLKQNLELVEAADANGLLPAEASKVADPGACALHLALLPMRPVKKRQRHQLRALIYQLVEEGPEQLSPADRRSLISDPESLVRLHTLSWSEGRDSTN
jgi:membrane glycosyltransferase